MRERRPQRPVARRCLGPTSGPRNMVDRLRKVRTLDFRLARNCNARRNPRLLGGFQEIRQRQTRLERTRSAGHRFSQKRRPNLRIPWLCPQDQGKAFPNFTDYAVNFKRLFYESAGNGSTRKPIMSSKLATSSNARFWRIHWRRSQTPKILSNFSTIVK